MDWFLNNLGAVIGIIITILVAVWAVRKNHNKSKPSYIKIHNNIFEDNFDAQGKLRISFDGTELSSCSVSKVLIWNDGDKAIRSTDIPIKDKLKIITSDNVEFLEITPLISSNDTCNVSHEQINDHLVEINFDYLEKNDGVLYQIFHSGTKSKDIEVKGTVIDSGKFVNLGEAAGKRFLYYMFIVLMLSAILPILYYFVDIFPLLKELMESFEDQEGVETFLGFSSFTIIYFGLIFSLIKSHKSAIPKQFRKHLFEVRGGKNTLLNSVLRRFIRSMVVIR